jgi:hypothetical protein
MEDSLWWQNGDVEEHLHGYGHYHETFRKEGERWLSPPADRSACALIIRRTSGRACHREPEAGMLSNPRMPRSGRKPASRAGARAVKSWPTKKGPARASPFSGFIDLRSDRSADQKR